MKKKTRGFLKVLGAAFGILTAVSVCAIDSVSCVPMCVCIASMGGLALCGWLLGWFEIGGANYEEE